FCVRGDGSLAPTPTVARATAGIEPRRLLVAGGVLYVAELNQVEAFKIGSHGGLQPVGNTEVLTKKETGNNMEAVDLTTSPDGTLSPAPLNCTQGSQKKKEQQPPLNKTDVVAAYQSLLLSRSTLFGIQFDHGRIDAYHVNSDGRLSQQPTREAADVRMTPVRG